MSPSRTTATPRRSLWGFGSIVVATVLGILGIVVGAFDPLWDLFGVSRDLRAAHNTGVAILLINAGFLVGVYFQQGDFKNELLEAQSARVAELISSLPTTGLFSSYTGDEAMDTLVAILPTVRAARNTRILASNIKVTGHGEMSPWDETICACVRDGLTFREVLSHGQENLARKRRTTTQGGRGVYEATILRHSLPSFLNFIILETRGGEKEVWFGWIVSRASGFEGTVIRTGEQRIVTLFERWHSELLVAGRIIGDAPTTA